MKLIVEDYSYANDMDLSKRECANLSTITTSPLDSSTASFQSSLSAKIFPSHDSSSSLSSEQNTVIQRNHSEASSPSASFSTSNTTSASSKSTLNSMQNVQRADTSASSKTSNISGQAESEDGEIMQGAALVREVGHNLYILAHKLARFNKELSAMLRTKPVDNESNQTFHSALSFYASRTAQIEVKN